MKHILCDMGNFLLKEKNSFMSGQNKFLARDGEGLSLGHNGETNFIDVFHVSDHLEQFGRLLFFFIFLGWKNLLFRRMGGSPPPTPPWKIPPK